MHAVFYMTAQIESFGYGKKLFEQLEISYQEGDKIGITGGNGIGKSTLVKILSGQIRSTKIKIDSILETGYFDSSYSLNDEYSFVDNCKLYKEYIQNNVVEDLVLKLDFEPYKNIKIKKLSKGNYIKAQLIFLFSLEKPFYYLDEPFTNLDRKSQIELINILQKSNFGFILISHNYDMIQSCCEVIYEIKDKALNLVN